MFFNIFLSKRQIVLKLTKEELEQRNRLKTVLKIKGIGRQQFADAIGRQIGYINQMLSGNRRVSENAVTRLIKRYKSINPDWIMEKKGEMFFPENGISDVIDVVEEPSAPYGPESKEDLFGDLRALLEHYEKRIAGLEGIVSAMDERMRRLEGGGK